MDNSVNTRPLLQRSDTDSDFDEDPHAIRTERCDDDSVKDTNPLFSLWEPTDR
jgi:hypothetical protein